MIDLRSGSPYGWAISRMRLSHPTSRALVHTRSSSSHYHRDTTLFVISHLPRAEKHLSRTIWQTIQQAKPTFYRLYRSMLISSGMWISKPSWSRDPWRIHWKLKRMVWTRWCECAKCYAILFTWDVDDLVLSSFDTQALDLESVQVDGNDATVLYYQWISFDVWLTTCSINLVQTIQ